MSTIPRRKPVGSATAPQPSSSQQLDANTGATPDVSQASSSRTDSSDEDIPETTSDGPNEDTLVLSKAKVEELAYMLLGLVGSAPQNRPGLHLSQGSVLSASSAIQLNMPSDSHQNHKAPVIVQQEMLKSSTLISPQMSESQLQQKPWTSERIVVDGMPVETVPVDPDVHATDGADANTEYESVQMMPNRPMGTLATLREDSLYMIQGNHAWKDLHTQLGPGRYTFEGRDWLLARRTEGLWPKVIRSQERAFYLMQLWELLIANGRLPHPKYSIISDLVAETDLSLAYKYVANKILRRPTTRKTQARKRARKGPLEKTLSKIQTASRAVFSWADSAKPRLPSTMFLRIIGQNLFSSCLQVNDSHGELLLRVLISSLKRLQENSRPSQATLAVQQVTDPQTDADPSSSSAAYSTTLWDLLVHCYGCKVLEQPGVGDDAALRSQVWIVLSALNVINMFTPELDKALIQSMGIDALLSSHVDSILPRSLLRHGEPIYPSEKQEYFGKKELCVKSLQDVGALNIVWTRHVDQHLTLDTDSSELRVFWPAWALANLPCASMFNPEPVPETLQDLLATYSFLFYSADGFYTAVTDYNNLDPPTWLGSMSTPLSELTRGDLLIGDVRYHFASYEQVSGTSSSNEANTMIRFDACGIFENRARILKGWMDNQKPAGLMALWRDKRDSGQWYTFWLVAIIGGISLLLAVMSLAVSVAQTAASFEALAIQRQQTNEPQGNGTSFGATAATI